MTRIQSSRPVLAGGRATFLPFHLPHIGDEEIRSVIEVLKSGWLTTGPRTAEFEAQFARFVEARHAVALNSGTAALHLALEAIGLKAGDEVLLPTFTFAATAEVVHYFKARPVLVDSRADTLNMDEGKLEAAITPRTRAIIPVHFGGHPCAMDGIVDVARRKSLAVIEDAAHALPASYHGKSVGSLGDITCFSFYATKTITTGEGGMATTANPEYAERMRLMSLHGISKDAWKRYTAEGSWYYEILQPGFKYNMTDMAAALGLEQLKRCRDMMLARSRIASKYAKAFKEMPEVRAPVSLPGMDHAWHLYVLQLEGDRLKIDRHQFIEELRKRNIGSSVHFIPLHVHPYYRESGDYSPKHYPVAHRAYERVISLPIYSRMSERDVEDVIEAVADVIRHNRR